MLFHPFEKQLNFPAFLIQFGNLYSCQTGVIGKEDKFFIGVLIIVLYPAKFIRIFLFWIIDFQFVYLIILYALLN